MGCPAPGELLGEKLCARGFTFTEGIGNLLPSFGCTIATVPRFQQGRLFRPWLMRILYRHALDVMEQQGTYLRPLSLDEVLESADPPDSDHHLEQGDMQERVAGREAMRQALAQLSAEQRHVIALRYGADLTEVDIAQVLGWPIGTVKSRLNRARAHLRVLLSEEER